MARRDHIVRLLKLAHALAGAGSRGVALRTLAERENWDLRLLYRDIEALGRAGVPVVHEEHRYRLLSGVKLPPLAGATFADEEERLALFLARLLARGWRTTRLGKALDRLWHRVTGGGELFPGSTSSFGVRTPEAIDYAAHRQNLVHLEHAVSEHIAARCRYRALSGEVTDRVIEPGELYWDPGLESLYVIAYCRLRQDLRVFAAHRFRAVVLTSEHFAPRRGVHSQAALKHAFRVWRSTHVDTVTLRFSAAVAAEVGERRWHTSQDTRREPDGRLVLSLTVAGLEEIERWVLSFGGDVEVLSPPALAQRVRAHHQRALAVPALEQRARAAQRKH